MARIAQKDRDKLMELAAGLRAVIVGAGYDRGLDEVLKEEMLSFCAMVETANQTMSVTYPVIGGGTDSTSIGASMLQAIVEGSTTLVRAIRNNTVYDAPSSSLQFALKLKDEIDGVGPKRTCAIKQLIGGCSEQDALTIQLVDAVLEPGVIVTGKEKWDKTEGHTVFTPAELILTLMHMYKLPQQMATSVLRDAMNAKIITSITLADGSKYAALPEIVNIDKNIKRLSKETCEGWSDIKVDLEGLTEEQTTFANAVLAPGGQIITLNAPGGTGKSHTTARPIAAALDAGLRVLCVAPTGMAAKVLHDFLVAAKVDTTALLYKGVVTIDRVRVSPTKLGDVDLVVIDEASMVSTRHLSFLSAAQNIKRIVMLGDTHQLRPVDAGAPFLDLCASFPTFSLTKNMRVGADATQLAVDLDSCRQGKGKISLNIPFAKSPYRSDWTQLGCNYHDTTLHAHLYASLRQVLDDALDRDVQILAHTNALVNAIARYAVTRRRLQASGNASDGILNRLAVAIVGSYFSFEFSHPVSIVEIPAGTRVYWTADRLTTPSKMYVYRGYEGVVKANGDVEIVATSQNGATGIAVIENALADGKVMPVCSKTVHKAQGQSVGEILYIIKKAGRTHDAELAYTASSRAKNKASVLSFCERPGSITLTRSRKRNTVLGGMQ